MPTSQDLESNGCPDLPMRYLSPPVAEFAWAEKPWRILLVPTGLLIAASIALTFDCSISEWCVDRSRHLSGDLRKASLLAELFGHGLGAALVLIAIHQLDRRRRWAIPRLFCMSFGAGLAADLVKMCIVRIRPLRFFDIGSDFSGSVADTFGPWLPGLSVGSSGQSFPSAHTATAVGLAIGLTWLYPRGRSFFLALALLVAVQRVQSGAHYPSDTLVGAALAWILAFSCLKIERLDAFFRWWEGYFEPRPSWPLHVVFDRPSSGYTKQNSNKSQQTRPLLDQ